MSSEACGARSSIQAGRQYQESKGENVFVCPGPEDYELVLVDDGTRSWYIVHSASSITSFEKEIVYDQNFGNFPNVAVGEVVEWRLDANGAVSGLIFRVHFSTLGSEGKIETLSRLFVVSLGADAARLIGVTSSNDAARVLSDKHLKASK